MQVSNICFALWFLFCPVKSGHEDDLLSQRKLLLVCIKLDFDNVVIQRLIQTWAFLSSSSVLLQKTVSKRFSVTFL